MSGISKELKKFGVLYKGTQGLVEKSVQNLQLIWLCGCQGKG